MLRLQREPRQELRIHLLPLSLMFIILWQTVSLIHNPASMCLHWVARAQLVTLSHLKDQLNRYDLNSRKHYWSVFYCLIMVCIITLPFSPLCFTVIEERGFTEARQASLLVVSSPKWYISMFQLFWVFCIAPVHLPVTIFGLFKFSGMRRIVFAAKMDLVQKIEITVGKVQVTCLAATLFGKKSCLTIQNLILRMFYCIIR
jgi:hypothetical protein